MGLFAPLNPPLPAWPEARVWVIGASTGIGAATATMRAGKFEITLPRAFTRQLKLLRVLRYCWHFSLIRKATGLPVRPPMADLDPSPGFCDNLRLWRASSAG